MNEFQELHRAASNTLQLQSHLPAQAQDIIEHYSDKCLIRPRCLDEQLVRTVSRCERQSLQRIESFFAKHPVLANYTLLTQRRIPQRSVMFATEILGSDQDLSEEQFQRKSTLHLMMSVQMTLQWLIDDTLDGESNIDIAFTEQIIRYCLDVIEAPAGATVDPWLLIFECLEHGMPQTFVDAITLLLEWQRKLAISLDISLAPTSIYSRFNRDFLYTFLNKNNKFEKLSDYLKYREANCGLAMEILCGAYWYYWLSGGDPAQLDQDANYNIKLIYRYSLLGGVSNDLFGYDKDLQEGIATSVEIAKLTGMSGRGSAEVRKTTEAFKLIIKLHNNLLDELIERICTCTEPLEYALLFASLTATWAIRMLHYEFRAIYRPGWLRKILPEITQKSTR